MPETLSVVTPWFPSPNKPFQGSFVRSQVRAVRPTVGRLDVLATEDWIAPRGSLVQRMLRRHYGDLAVASMRPALTEDDVWLTRLPVLVQPRRPWDQYARAVADGVRVARVGRRLDGAVVHAHVGLPGALVAVENAEPGARVVVTEHASYLAYVLAQDGARALYDELVGRADAWICVSGVLRDQLLSVFPHHRDRVHVVGNPVDFDRIAVREQPPARPRRWIYVGSLIERKGPLRLVEALARCRVDEPDLELTLLGDGAQKQEVLDLVEELGLGDAVRVLDPVPPDEVFRLMREHDLLVHPSHHETFGMTPVEALATGTPVMVARYAAAEEVLAGVEETAGGIVEIGNGSDEIVEGYRALRDRWHTVDALAARETMRGRYGFEAVAAALHDLYATPTPQLGGADRRPFPRQAPLPGTTLARPAPHAVREAVR